MKISEQKLPHSINNVSTHFTSSLLIILRK